MLRHLLDSTARTSSRSLLAKPSAPVYVSSHRSFYPQKDGALTGQSESTDAGDQKGKDKRSYHGIGLGFCLGVGTLSLISWLDSKSGDAFYSIARGAPSSHLERNFEGLTMRGTVNRPVNLSETRPVFHKERAMDGLDYRLRANVHVKLPHFRATADYKEICEFLKQVGIHVERTEEGANRGLAELVLKKMYLGYHELNQETAPKTRTVPKAPGLPQSSPDAKIPLRAKAKSKSIALALPSDYRIRKPTTRPFAVRVKLPHASTTPEFKEICDGLRTHGIEVERAVTDTSAFHLYYRKGNRSDPEDMKHMLVAMEKLLKMEKDAAARDKSRN